MANRSPEPIGDFVRRIRKQKGLSLEAVSRESARFGPRIAASYISRIENEPKRRPTADRLMALAYGLGVPVEELLTRAARRVSRSGEDDDELQLLTRFRELSPDRRADVLKMVDLWHADEASRRTRVVRLKPRRPKSS